MIGPGAGMARDDHAMREEDVEIIARRFPRHECPRTELHIIHPLCARQVRYHRSAAAQTCAPRSCQRWGRRGPYPSRLPRHQDPGIAGRYKASGMQRLSRSGQKVGRHRFAATRPIARYSVTVRSSEGEHPLWQRYEMSVHEMLAALDPNAEVIHNTRVDGRFSQTKRQIDIWAVGRIVGLEVSVAVECKRRRRVVDVETVDAFVGKLIDIGADRGLIYSYSGFTNAAVARAISHPTPGIAPIALDTPKAVHELKGVPGYPVDLTIQDMPPFWIEDLPSDSFAAFLKSGNALEIYEMKF